MTSPTARTLTELRARGYEADVVERRVFRMVTKDFLGVIDLIAVKGGEPPLAVQATSLSNAAARLAKARAEPRLRAWLGAGGRFEVWAWGKRGGRWVVRRVELTGAELAPRDLTPRPPRCRKVRGLFDGLARKGTMEAEPTTVEATDEDLHRWEGEGGACPPDDAPHDEILPDAHARD